MPHQHFKIYKPYGIISQTHSNDARQVRKKRFLKELYDFPEDIMPIGRLDEKSEGLLLMTTDGKLSDTVNRSGLEKEYFAQVDGEITDEAIIELQHGLKIGLHGSKYKTLPCKARRIEVPNLPERKKKIRDARHGPTSWVSIVLTEGKFHQVRKMTSAVGFPTLRLVRVRIGDIHLNEMQPGDVIPIVI
ncbi:pseudouridine synthase [Galbibacter mesophilus]|uniref:pseudouridine synthase n=1 Tax=Galbibacter mesophilus TaxID=379069 RepID=UPI00191E652C|nr:pseudouridine synthase [Galbibacter mesophilus]MCM5662914.1 pseudouridine synthase [Galbibacter mesophilus]